MSYIAKEWCAKRTVVRILDIRAASIVARRIRVEVRFMKASPEFLSTTEYAGQELDFGLVPAGFQLLPIL
jgi:hypothetical protein